MGGKKLAKRIGRELGAEIRKCNDEIIHVIRREISNSGSGVAPVTVRSRMLGFDKEMQKRRETVSHMIEVLSEHPFGVGKDAQTLKEMELKLLERKRITHEDAIAVFKIMQTYARSDAEQMEMDGTAPIF